MINSILKRRTLTVIKKVGERDGKDVDISRRFAGLKPNAELQNYFDFATGVKKLMQGVDKAVELTDVNGLHQR